MAQRRWAVEGASGLDRGIAQLLVAAEEQVLDVPAKLSARARLLSTTSARKTDLADGCSVAAAALHHRRLRPVALEDQTVIFRLLSDHRDDLVAERTRTLSRLHVLLCDLQPGGANQELTATRAAALLCRVTRSRSWMSNANASLGHSGDITRFPDRDHFASHTGTAPMEASSGMGAAIA